MALRCLRSIGVLSSQLRGPGFDASTRLESATLWLGPAGSLLRGLGSSSALAFPDIIVPPMGDSISEGTVAALLKNVGDSVAVDETIAQVETDKVTIDIRSTAAGTIKSLKVKANDTVTPGQVIASVTEGTAAGGPQPPAAGKSEPAPKAAPSPATPAAGGSSSSSSSDGHAPSRHVGIHFPPRRTETGARISDMPAKEALEYLAKHSGGGDGAAVSASERATPSHGDSASSATHPPAAAGDAPAAGAAAANDKLAPPPPRAQAMGHAPKAPSLLRRELSERELEAINLGGAM